MSAAERHLVGAVLRDPTVYGRVQVVPVHFSDLGMRAIWVAMGRMYDTSQPIDELTVADALGSTLDAYGGLSMLAGLAADVSTTSNVEYYAGLVRDKYLARQVREKASEILNTPDTVKGEELLGSLGVHFEGLSASLSRPARTLGAVVGSEIAAVLDPQDDQKGLPTGLGIDRWLPGGFPRKKVITLFADTGSFKTTAVNQMMFHQAGEGYRGLLVPLEDSDELTAHRWISRKTGVDYGHIAGGVCTDAERQKISLLTAGDWAILDNIRSCDGIEPRIDNIVREVAAAKANGGIDFVVVDYIQLLEGRGKPMDIMTEAMKKAANAAKRYDVCWVYVSQQNDKNADRKDPRPHLGDMFGSSSMKQQSKTVLSLFRPSEHWPEPKGASHPLWGMYAKLIEQKGQRGMEVYKNIVELWMLKNVLGPKKALQLLIAKPEVGILDPVPGLPVML